MIQKQHKGETGYVDGYIIFGPKERVVLLCTVPEDQPCHDIPTITMYFISYSGWMLFSLYFPGYCIMVTQKSAIYAATCRWYHAYFWVGVAYLASSWPAVSTTLTSQVQQAEQCNLNTKLRAEHSWLLPEQTDYIHFWILELFCFPKAVCLEAPSSEEAENLQELNI